MLKNLGKHSLGSLLVGGECALRLFGRKPNATVGQIVNGGLRIFNLKEAQEVQDGLKDSARDCHATIQEYKKQIALLEKQSQNFQRQYGALNDLISLFIQTTK